MKYTTVNEIAEAVNANRIAWIVIIGFIKILFLFILLLGEISDVKKGMFPKSFLEAEEDKYVPWLTSMAATFVVFSALIYFAAQNATAAYESVIPTYYETYDITDSNGYHYRGDLCIVEESWLLENKRYYANKEGDLVAYEEGKHSDPLKVYISDKFASIASAGSANDAPLVIVVK